MDHDLGTVTTTNVRSGLASDVANNDIVDATWLHQQFLSFLQLFHGPSGDFSYLVQLRRNVSLGQHFVEVNLSHLIQFSEPLGHALVTAPTRSLPSLERAATELCSTLQLFPSSSVIREVQVQLIWHTTPVSLRNLAKEEIAKLVCVSGIVVKSSSTHVRCVKATIQCTSCRSKTTISGGAVSELPAQCHENGMVTGNRQRCRPYPYVLLPDQCSFEDQQSIKLQELPEEVPTGELPRHATVVVDRYLVDRIAPGARVIVIAVVSVQEKKSREADKARGAGRIAGLRAQFLRGVGVITAGDLTGINETTTPGKTHDRLHRSWNPADEARFKTFARAGNVYDRISRAIDPAVFGLVDQKKAIACLLFGGNRKLLDGNYLRGDMNVLFVGDPSTAKSQLLKFTERVAPIGIYTSGKGSSAAGLTAAVVGGGNGEFWLEAGSMVLADGGVVCIDEFDKMREQDQVAIHEAMEQQTISLAKANLTTMLNSRTSVLAAANPSLGSYDPTKSNEDQMDFQSSILSRFDLIFRVLDPRNEELDGTLARHVISVHKSRQSTKNAPGQPKESTAGEIPLSFITQYVSYARSTCYPRLTTAAANLLLDYFVSVRKNAREASLNSNSNTGSTAIQITPRQLESLVRISEALAKMRLDSSVKVEDAKEAMRLFAASTFDAIQSGVVEGTLSEEQNAALLQIEDAIRRRLTVGTTVQQSRLVIELHRIGFDPKMIDRAIFAMMKREELEWRKQRTLLCRLR